MNSKLTDVELIDKYFEFQLSEEELVAFEKRILVDSEFEQKVLTYYESEVTTNVLFENHEQQQRAQKWKELLDKEHTPKSKVISLKWQWISGIAASILIIFGIWQFNTKTEPLDLTIALESAWNKKVGLDYNTLRSSVKDSLKNQIVNAYRNYENKKYDSTLVILNHFKKTSPYYEDALLLRGLSLYENGFIEVSLKTLDTLVNYPTQKKAKVALWYQGLIYLKEGNLIAAKKILALPEHKNNDIKLKE